MVKNSSKQSWVVNFINLLAPVKTGAGKVTVFTPQKVFSSLQRVLSQADNHRRLRKENCSLFFGRAHKDRTQFVMQLTHFCSVTAAISHLLPRFHPARNEKSWSRTACSCTHLSPNVSTTHLGQGA